MVDFYSANLLVFATLCASSLLRKASARKTKAPELENLLPDDGAHAKRVGGFLTWYLVVYVCVTSADWLQGPHIFAVYRSEMGLPEEVVARLFSVGFLSGAVSAYFVGGLADRFGRRLMCQVFCLVYAGSCASVLRAPPVGVLYAGRVLGGVATSILFSAFEAWAVAEFRARRLRGLKAFFALLVSVNSAVAVLAGVVSEWLVAWTGTRTSPFVASCVFLLVAFLVISGCWVCRSEVPGGMVTDGKWGQNENYGDRESGTGIGAKNALEAIFTDSRVLSLCLTSIAYESSMYLFVFLWAPTLSSAAHSPLPYGVVFASFMVCMSLGSTLLSPYLSLSPMIFVAAAALFVPVLFGSERATFYAFCTFEASVGVYYPAMAALKGRCVSGTHRAAVYALLRVPLNVLVVGGLAVLARKRTGEGDDKEVRGAVLMFCSGILVLGAVVLREWVEGVD